MDVTAQTRELRDDASAPPEAGRTFAGRYHILSTLGEGGFGTVYAARDQQLDRDVAIKVLDDDDAVALTRFLLEAKIIAALASEHIVTVYEAAVAGRKPYYVMERLSGSDLADVVQKRGKLPPAEAVEYLLQATLGVAIAHGRGVVHRDLKPRNLFLAERADGSRIVKVLDFGVAKLIDSQLTESGAAIGTMRYMSPEQLRSSASVDARTDIWSLGVVLYELVTGKPLFDAQSGAAVGVAILTERHVPVRKHVPEVSSELAGVIDRCLEKDPDNRYQSTFELARALGSDPDRLARIEHARNPAGVTLAESVTPPRSRTNRALIAGSIIGAGGIAFGIAMALRTPDPEVRIVERPVLITIDAAIASTDAIDTATPRVPIIVDAAVAVPVDARVRQRPPRDAAPPVPKQPSQVEIDGIFKTCNDNRVRAPQFLIPNSGGGAYTCRQIALIGCKRMVAECARFAESVDEKQKCRDFIIKIRNNNTCPGI